LPSISIERMARWLRLARLSTRRSRRRLTFLGGGIAVGAAAVLFALAADQAQALFRTAIAQWRFAPLAVTPAMFMVLAYVTRRFLPLSRGSGIPQTMAARRINDREQSRALVSMPVAAGKMLLTLLGLLSGASIGREGPTVQVGAAIMAKVGELTRIQRSGLILAGACAGVAAAFNTPLAGIVFGIEEMSQSFERRTNGLILTTVIVAGLSALTLLGNYTYFGSPSASLPDPADWIAVPACGLAGGLAGAVFSRVLIQFARGIPGRAGAWIKDHPYLFAGCCGLGVAFCGLGSANAVFGTGYAQARGLLDGSTPIPAAFGALKLVATILSSIAGIPGGIFSPSLAIGAGLGSNLSAAFPHADPSALFLLGMASYLTGVVQAPITSVVIVTEMTNGHAMILPLMAAAVIAQGASRLICPKGVYHALAEGFLPATGADRRP
jgi:H+/Cl- antiporter ClcA